VNWPPVTRLAESEQREDRADLDTLGDGRLHDRWRLLEREGLFGGGPDLCARLAANRNPSRAAA
jgi:hypothetical protein